MSGLSGDGETGDLSLADFWGGGPVPLAPDEPPGVPDPAYARFAPLPRAIRGRISADWLRSAYQAMTSR
ncbi:MAG: hypothetical protein HOV66_12780 [Streptomycetaceae bacterium]|nr:hypothetical protein [Streptomycetaceae bacterium]NUS55709.1 hypothetical protein [Streptomycetaceae bacterium]